MRTDTKRYNATASGNVTVEKLIKCASKILTVVKATLSRPHSLKLDLWVVLQSANVT